MPMLTSQKCQGKFLPFVFVVFEATAVWLCARTLQLHYLQLEVAVIFIFAKSAVIYCLAVATRLTLPFTHLAVCRLVYSALVASG